MAGGIDWFRWHHGSVTDPKFQLVARKSGASLPDVLAVWAYLLEKASAAEFRGCFGEVDCEAVDCLFGFSDGATDAILSEMVERKLIADEYVVAWEKRQPKREREGDKSTERVQAFRQRQRQETPGNATERQETPRGEESREEEKREQPKKEARKRAAPVGAACPEGVGEDVWRDWTALRKAKRAPVSPTVMAEAEREAAKAGMTLEAFLRVWCARGSQGLQADWLKPHEVGSVAVKSANSVAMAQETAKETARQDAHARKLADPEEQARIAAIREKARASIKVAA